MADTELQSVEETSQSPQATTAPAAPAATVTTIAPPENQQSVLDVIRKASNDSGGFELQNGKVVVKRPEAPAPVTPAAKEQPTAEFEDLVVNGETVRVPKSELKSLAQQGYRFTQKTQELSAEKRQVEEMKAAVLALMAEQQPDTGTATESGDANAEKALLAVKEQFGKDDPDFEFDPLDRAQNTAYIRALNKLDTQAERAAQQRTEQDQAQAAREARLSEWEAGQRAADPLYGDAVAYILENVGTPERPISRLKTMLSAADFEAADAAFRNGDTAALNRVVTFAKKTYQTQKLGLSTRPTTPPLVQSPGNGSKPVHTVVKGDAKVLGTMTKEEKTAWIREEMTRRSRPT